MTVFGLHYKLSSGWAGKGTWNLLSAIAAILGVFLFQSSAVLYFPQYHDLLRHLYYMPIILSAYLLGPRFGVFFGLLSAVGSSAHIAMHGRVMYIDLVLQASIFCVTGALIGYLSSEEKRKSSLLESSKMDFLKGLSAALDARDTYTEGHSLRVAGIAREIGKELRMSEDALGALYQAGIIHDIGKIGIPDAILKKEGKLTQEEYALIKTHTRIGAAIVRDVEAFRTAVAGVKSHHERYDGSGYPEGLRGEDIPPDARIIAVADAFDAMTSVRVYNRRKDTGAALEEIERGAGNQFDPGVVRAFRNVAGRLDMEKLEGVAVDPVCRMKVNPATAPASFEYKGTVYYFCSRECGESFTAFPEKYVSDARSSPDNL